MAVNDSVVLEDVNYREASGFSASTQVLPTWMCWWPHRYKAIEATLALTADTKYTVIAVNQVAAIEPLVITDSDTPAAGFAQLTVVHGAPGAPAVDVYVSGPDDDFAGLSRCWKMWHSQMFPVSWKWRPVITGSG